MKLPGYWSRTPPPLPAEGQPWLDTSMSTYAPALWVYDGAAWLLIGTLNTLATTLTVPTDGSVGVLNIPATDYGLGQFGPRPVVVSGSGEVRTFGVASFVRSHVVVFAGSVLLSANPGVLDLPAGRPIQAVFGDVALFVTNGGLGRRLASYWSPLVIDGPAIQTTWVSFGATGAFRARNT